VTGGRHETGVSGTAGKPTTEGGSREKMKEALTGGHHGTVASGTAGKPMTEGESQEKTNNSTNKARRNAKPTEPKKIIGRSTEKSR
jgi:hypothetical protein